MGRKLPGNPLLAYQMGVKEGTDKGYAAGYKDGGYDCIDLARHFAALAIYNVARDFTRSDKKEKELVLAFCEEQNRLYGDEFYNDPDQVMVAKAAVEKIYKEIGFLQPDKQEYKPSEVTPCTDQN